MIRISYFTFITLTVFVIAICKSEDRISDPTLMDYVVGKNRFTTQVDGDTREYYVHVPAKYNPSTATPVVFMLHGTGGDGEKFYNISGWKEIGETENILTVFPSSWRYCIIDEGVQKTTTKWNSQPAEWQPCAGERLRDDVKFLSTIISELKARFNVDSKRIYLVGFSNGGQMAAKCTIAMSNKFAAIVESAGSFYGDTTWVPLRKMPITFQVGNEDYGPGNTGPPIPLSILDTLLSTPNLQFSLYYRIANVHVKSFELNPNFTISGDTNTVVVATYKPLVPDPNNVFNFVLIKGLGHVYPNGTNHWLKAAKVNWAWMKNYTLPDTTSSVENQQSAASGYQLTQNYPNPFNSSTTIPFSLPKTEYVTLKVLDVLGNEITTLVNGEMTAGEHSVVFDAKDLSTGVYFYSLQAGNFVQQRKMEVIK
jgi:poly(3-hydroxybutyrate) depolymerase